MRFLRLILPIIYLFTIVSCDGDYRPMSMGAVDEVIVVMDSTFQDSQTALAIESTFGKYLTTLPAPEATYRLIYKDFSSNEELEEIQLNKNIIFVSPIDADTNVGTLIRAILSDDVENRVREGDSFAFPLRNRWVRDQWTLLLTSNSDEELAEKIRNSEESLVGNLMNLEFERRTYEIYERGEQVAISDSLWENHGWSIRMQHDYVQSLDMENVTVFRRYLPENNRWIMAWWKDGVEDPDYLGYEWINATRDSLLEKYMRGEREGSYLTTEYGRDVITKQFEREDNLIAYETLGTWRMTNDFMGGPFVNFTYYDPNTSRLFMIEYGQFAPSVSKRRFVRQFRAMGRTFQSDSTWNSGIDQISLTGF